MTTLQAGLLLLVTVGVWALAETAGHRRQRRPLPVWSVLMFAVLLSAGYRKPAAAWFALAICEAGGVALLRRVRP